jgi:Leucine-rich repeat (LRR) protein
MMTAQNIMFPDLNPKINTIIFRSIKYFEFLPKAFLESDYISNIQYLNITMCNLKIIQKILLPRKLQNLMSLNMRHNKIKFIENEAFKYLLKMVFLDISNNDIKILFKSTFAGLTNLREIDLSGNPIVALEPDVFLQLKFLPEIMIRDMCMDSSNNNGPCFRRFSENNEYFRQSKYYNIEISSNGCQC